MHIVLHSGSTNSNHEGDTGMRRNHVGTSVHTRASVLCPSRFGSTANLRTKILDFRRFDSSRILILRGGILRPIGNFLESLSQAIIVGVILVGRLGVMASASTRDPLPAGADTQTRTERIGRFTRTAPGRSALAISPGNTARFQK